MKQFEYATDRVLGANAPTFKVSMAVLRTRIPVKIDPTICGVPSGCTAAVVGKLASGQYRCHHHLLRAEALGYGVIWELPTDPEMLVETPCPQCGSGVAGGFGIDTNLVSFPCGLCEGKRLFVPARLMEAV